MNRYAIYSAPQTDSSWWRVCSQWLGRDAHSGVLIEPNPIKGIDQEILKELTREPRRYGLHATLKAPFQLRKGQTLAELKSTLSRWSLTQKTFDIALGLERFRDFFALTPPVAFDQINILAEDIVRYFDDFREPLPSNEMDKRRQLGLSADEDALLRRWGYPYVLERFKFHITLTGNLKKLEPSTIDLIEREIRLTLENLKSDRYTVDSVCLFGEPHPGADFLLLERFNFGQIT
jgi:hypothetical protein